MRTLGPWHRASANRWRRPVLAKRCAGADDSSGRGSSFSSILTTTHLEWLRLDYFEDQGGKTIVVLRYAAHDIGDRRAVVGLQAARQSEREHLLGQVAGKGFGLTLENLLQAFRAGERLAI